MSENQGVVGAVAFGLPFWNHMLFFGLCFVFIIFLADLLRGKESEAF